jgi:hypothetical protein
MTMTMMQIEEEVFQLPVEQQRRIAGDIWSRQAMTDEESEDLRIVRERIKSIDSGEAVTVDGTKAIADIRAELMQHR